MISLRAAPPGPPPTPAPFWEQYVLLQLVAWDGDLFANGCVETLDHDFAGGLRGGGRVLATPGTVGGYFDPNRPPGPFISTPDPLDDEAFFHLSTWSDWLDDPGTGQVVPFDAGSGVTDATATYSYECNVCSWLAAPLFVDGRATFRVAEGDAVVHNTLQSPAISFTTAGDSQTHYLIAQSGAWIEDWVYVDGPGPTATLELSATVQGSVDVPVAPASFVAGIYGDLITSDPGSLPIPIGVGQARISSSASLYVELQIGAPGTFPAPIDFQQRVDLEWSSDTPSWNTQSRGSFDGDELVTVSREVPTAEWVRVYAGLDGHSFCAGALACDLETQVELQVTSIQATGGVVRSANGIAGTQAVPEPGAGALAIAALGAISLRCRFGSRLDRAAGEAMLRARRTRDVSFHRRCGLGSVPRLRPGNAGRGAARAGGGAEPRRSVLQRRDGAGQLPVSRFVRVPGSRHVAVPERHAVR